MIRAAPGHHLGATGVLQEATGENVETSKSKTADEEGLATIEKNADILLEEIGIEFRDFPKAIDLFKNAGADIDGERIRFPKGFCREIIQSSAPSEYIQHARNPKNNVVIGGKNTVLVPAYGPPFVRDLDKGRRYATLEDFQNFVESWVIKSI